MSLLMEALRKAEEAKRKAAGKAGSVPDESRAKSDLENVPPAGAREPPGGGMSADRVEDSPPRPVGEPGSSLQDRFFHKTDTDAPAVAGGDEPVVSPGQRFAGGVELEPREDEADEPSAIDETYEDTETAEPAEATETAEARDLEYPGRPASGVDLPGRRTEFDDRRSAGALFRAKKAEQGNRLKKIAGLAAAIILLPAAGGLYWFYSSYLASVSVPVAQAPDFAGLEAARDRNVATGGVPVTGGAAGEGAAAVLNGDTAALAAVEGEAPEDRSVEAEREAGTDLAAVDGTGGNLSPAEVDSQREPLPPAVAQAEVEVNAAAGNAGVDIDQAESAAAGAAQENGASTAGSDAPETAAAPAGNDASETTAERSSESPRFVLTRGTDSASAMVSRLRGAYQTFQKGDYAGARGQYAQVLDDWPNNRDALLGLAAIDLKQGEPVSARGLYLRVLELNPRDPLARAGLLETTRAAAPLDQESELKALLALYPDVAPLSFALGNMYAAQSRWSEARGAYFNALLTAKASGMAPVSPDYAFNLAVSLERLEEWRSAYDYYREARDLAGAAPPGFDLEVLGGRLDYLERILQ